MNKCDKCKVINRSSKMCKGCIYANEIETFLKSANSVFRKILAHKSVLIIYHQNGSFATTDETLNEKQIADLKSALNRCHGYQKIRFLKMNDFMLQIQTAYEEYEDGLSEWDLRVELHLPKRFTEPGYPYIFPT